MRTFADRHEAGRALGTRLAAYADRPDLVVLVLPRGGVPVAFEVARTVDAAPASPLLLLDGPVNQLIRSVLGSDVSWLSTTVPPPRLRSSVM